MNLNDSFNESSNETSNLMKPDGFLSEDSNMISVESTDKL